MRKIYDAVILELKKLDFHRIWEGFYEFDFALYNMEKVYLRDREIPYDNRFLGNTQIEFEGKHIAIWHLDGKETVILQELTANLVHEMFHAFQMKNGESRFPDNLKGLDIPKDANYFAIKRKEAQKLVFALNSTNTKEMLSQFYEFVSLRKKRRKISENTFVYELHIETVEGCAEYCGTKALSVLSADLYGKRIADYKNKIEKNTSLLFDTRRYCYFTGALIPLLLDKLNIRFPTKIDLNTETLYEWLECSLPDIPQADESENSDEGIEKYYLNEITRREALFSEFITKDIVKTEGDFYICGYDPMNMVKAGNRILHTHFIFLSDISGNKQFFKGPVVTELKKDSSNEICSYYTNK